MTLGHCDAGADATDVTVVSDLLADADFVTVDRLAADAMDERNTHEEPERVSSTPIVRWSTTRAAVRGRSRRTRSSA